MKIACSFLTVLVALSTGACGAVSGNTDEPTTLASIHGQLTNPDSIVVDSGALRVAVVWSADANKSVIHAAQDVAVTPQFPAGFTVNLTMPPPTSAMIDSKVQGLRIAYGAVIAYEDRNHNGQLDLVDPSAPNYVDRVVAANENTVIFYLEGTLPDSATDITGTDKSLPSLGFNFYTDTFCFGGQGPSGKPCEEETSWKPISEPITLSLSDSPHLAQLMCKSSSGGTSSTGGPVRQHPAGEMPSEFPAKNDKNLVCAAGGRSYSFLQCTTTSSGLCGEVTSTCEGNAYSLTAGQAVPSGWPCVTQ